VYDNAKTLYRSEKYADAIKEFEIVLAKNPDHRYAGRYIEACRKRIEESGVGTEVRSPKSEVREVAAKPKDIIAEIAEKDKRSVPRIYKNAVKLFKQKNYAEAKTEFQLVLYKDPKHKKAPDFLVKCDKYLAPPPKVAEVMEKTMLADKSDSVLLYEEGKKLYRADRIEQAAELFKRVVELDPNHIYAERYLEKCQDLLGERKGYKPKAEDVKFKITPKDVRIDLSKETRSVEEIYESGKAFFRIEKYADAYVEFTKVLFMDPLYKDVEEYMHNCVSKLKRDREIIFNLKDYGKMFYSEGRYQESLAQFEQALKLDPNDAESKEFTVRCRASIEQQKERKYRISKLVSEGVTAYQNEKYIDAIKYLEKAQNLDPNNSVVKDYYEKAQEKIKEMDKETSILITKGKQAFEEGRYNDSIVFFNEVLSLDPENYTAKDYIVKINNEIGSIEERKKELERKEGKLSQGLDDLVTNLNKAKALYEAGRIEESLEIFNKVKLQGFTNKELEEYRDACKTKIELDKQQVYLKSKVEEKKEEKEEKKIEKKKELQVFDTANIDIRDEKRSADQIYEKGKELYRSEKYKEAYIEFKKVLLVEPGHVYAPRYIERCVDRLGEDNVKTLSLEKKDTGALRKSREKKVEPVVLKGEVRILYEKGKKLYNEGNFRDAASVFKQVLKAAPSHEYAKRYLEHCEDKFKEIGVKEETAEEK
ncbi:tetratricopeptide repeat protein, partial [bacterium]|nr:tetratricopeptide repeat protein [bacterium]